MFEGVYAYEFEVVEGKCAVMRLQQRLDYADQVGKIQINSKVMATCTMFANYTSSLSRYLASADPDLAASSASTGTNKSSTTAQAQDPARLDKLFSILQQYEDHFQRHLKILLDALY